MDPLRTSDIALIGTAAFLGVAALAAPAVAEWLKRRFWAPKLEIGAIMAPPDCHRTKLDVGGPMPVETRSVFVYRLRVTNIGRSQARRCEMLVEGIGRENAAGKIVWYENYTPVPLVWGAGYNELVDINPGRRYYCDLFNVLHPDHQRIFREGGGFIEWPDTAREGNGLQIRTDRSLYSQPNWLTTGKYRIRVALYSENAPVARLEVMVSWSGAWCETESSMFNECVMEPVVSVPFFDP